MEKTSTWKNHKNDVDLVLKKIKDFILTFSMGGSFFSEKEIWNFYTMIFFSFTSAG